MSNLSTQVAPGVRPLVDGIQRGTRAGSQDTFVIDLRGSSINSDVDIERAVKKVQDARDSRLGRRRVIP